jgi:tetratricopeptide (TPR) repeat protein
MDLSEDATRWIFGVGIPVALIAATMLILGLVSRKPAVTFRFGGLVILFVALFALLIPRVPRDFRPLIPVTITLVTILVAAIGYYRSTPMQRKYGRLAPLMAAHRSGDYEAVLRFCDLHVLSETREELFRGCALYSLRRMNDAESHLRNALTKNPEPVLQALILDQLGMVLIEQGRNDDAVRCFQQSEKLDPQRGTAFQCEAVVYLRGEYQPEKALELAREAVERTRKQSSELQAVSLSTSLAALGWALAVNGRADDARESVRQALEQAQPDSVPSVAEDYYLAGRAMLAAGDPDTASQYLRKVADVDKKGNFGYLARQQLDALA